MSTLTYKCPCCGASLAYDGVSRRLQCASCGNSFDLQDIEALEATGSQSSIDFVQPDEQFTDEEIEAISSYVCQNCGAELMTDSTTTATECAYCGSPAILPQEIDAGVRPQKVVPFRITKEQAERYSYVLNEHNKWRRDEHIPNSLPMQDPTELGLAIDFATDVIRTFKRL